MTDLKELDPVASGYVDAITEDFCIINQRGGGSPNIDIYQAMLEMGWQQFTPPIKEDHFVGGLLDKHIWLIYFQKIHFRG